LQGSALSRRFILEAGRQLTVTIGDRRCPNAKPDTEGASSGHRSLYVCRREIKVELRLRSTHLIYDLSLAPSWALAGVGRGEMLHAGISPLIFALECAMDIWRCTHSVRHHPAPWQAPKGAFTPHTEAPFFFGVSAGSSRPSFASGETSAAAQ
jgi:hypothetical protein